MGAKGGAVLVRVWRCSTCRRYYDRSDGGREEAVRCCNEAAHEAEAKRDEARARRIFAEVRKPRARFERDELRRTFAIATAHCPMLRCYTSRTVRVAVGDRWNGKLSKKDAAKKAAALAVAGIGKHLRSRYSHSR